MRAVAAPPPLPDPTPLLSVLPCQVPGVTGSELGLVGPVSV